MKFNELNIGNEILRAIDDLGYEKPSPIQEESIPHLLEGNDLIGKSQTGSGKTAAFAIPIIENIEANGITQALILCPTRELSIQVSKEIEKLCKYKKEIKILPVYGGSHIVRQIKSLKKGVEIVVGTPGRLMDLMRRKVLRLDQLKTIVLDEADEMFDMGFRDDMKFILDRTNRDRQTCFFSATMGPEIQEFSKLYQTNPYEVKIKSKEVTVDRIDQYYIKLKESMKEEALMRLIEIHKPNLAIIFCNTKRKVDRLVESLTRKNYLVDGLHGDLKQSSRDQVMKKFRNKTIQILVATDIAARGLDVDDVDIVFNYYLPQLDEYYVHRIGRTARAGKSGLSFSLISGRDNNRLRQIENYTKANIKHMIVPTLVQMYRQSDLHLIEDISSKLDNNEDLNREKNILIRLMEKGYDPFIICQILLKDKLNTNNHHEKLEGIDLKSEKKSKSKSNNKTKNKYDKEMTTLFMNRGKIDNFTKDKIIKALARMAKVPKDKIGQIRIQKSYSFIDLEKSEAYKAIRSINNKKISGKKVKIEESNK